MLYILSTHSGNTVQTQKQYALNVSITMGKWGRVQKPDFILTNNNFQKVKAELRDPNTPLLGAHYFVINIANTCSSPSFSSVHRICSVQPQPFQIQ